MSFYRKMPDGAHAVITANTKNEVVLVRYDAAKHGTECTTYGEGDGDACYAKMQEVAKANKLTINKYSLWVPDDVKSVKAADREAVLLMTRYGKPSILITDPNSERAKKAAAKRESKIRVF